MMRVLYSFLWLGLMQPFIGAEEAPLISGPRPGTLLSPVLTYDGQGPYRGQEFDAAAEIGQNPGALLFVNSATRNTYPVLQGVDQLAGRLSLYGFRAFTIHLDDDRNAAEHRIQRRNGEATGGHKFSVTGKYGALHLEMPMMLSLDGLDGPGGYALNRRAVMTLVTVRSGQVVSSHTFTDTGQHDLPLLERMFEDALGPLPTTAAEQRALRDERLPTNADALRQLAIRYLAFWGWQDTVRHPMLSVIEELTGNLPDPEAALEEWVSLHVPTDREALREMAIRQSAELFDLHTRLFAAREGRLPYTAMKTPAIRERMRLPINRPSLPAVVTQSTTTAPIQPALQDRRASSRALPSDPKLRQLYRSLIRKNNDSKTTDQILAEILRYANKSAALRQQSLSMMKFTLFETSLGNNYTRARITEHLERQPK